MKLAICEAYGKVNVIDVLSEKEAVSIQQKFVDDNNLGSSSFGFAFIIENNSLSKIISYNGRTWTPEEMTEYIGSESWYGKQMIKFGYTGKFKF